MDADPTLLAPQDYSLVWPVLGGFILVVLLIWALVVWMLTRRPERGGHGSLPPAAVTTLRDQALARIDEVERAVTEREMPPRRGHHELSRIVRDFVSRSSGLEAETMTAADLRARGPAHLADLIERFYPRQFGAAEVEHHGFTDSAHAARRVVGGWHG